MSMLDLYCLIVDENEFERRRMRQVMKRACPRVPMRIAQSLQEARVRLVEFPVGLILLENALPDGRGIDFVAELSRLPQTRDIPVALVSDYPTPFMRAKAESLAVRRIWTKAQFTESAAAALVQDCVMRVPQERALQAARMG